MMMGTSAMREQHPLPTEGDYLDALTALVEKVNGFVYMGTTTEAILDTIRVLRADPELAAKLLEEHT